MSIARGLRNRRLIVISHRQELYEYALDEIISGKVASTAHCTYRWNKLKQIRGK